MKRTVVEVMTDLIHELENRYKSSISAALGCGDDTEALLDEANELRATLETLEEYKANMYDLEGAEKRKTDLEYKRMENDISYVKVMAKNCISDLSNANAQPSGCKALEVIQLIHDITGKLIELDEAMKLAEAADTLAEISQPREDVYAAAKDIEYYCDQAGYYAVG